MSFSQLNLMKQTIFLFLLLFLFQNELAAQLFVEGSVKEAQSGNPLPFANIYLKSNSSIGTISNPEGRFLLKLPPEVSKDDHIIISFIGFENESISIQDLSGSFSNIHLRQSEKLLSEIIIMPDDTLKSLLTRAFARIKLNYPQYGSLIKGFYRETNQQTSSSKFIYFSESNIEFYKPSYETKSFGPVRIIDGGIFEGQSRSQRDIYFYAGPYFPQRIDFVKEREEFINPRKFHLYDYELIAITSYDGEEVYVVRFKPKSTASFNGKFYLSKKSLAFMAAEFSYTDHGLRIRNLNVRGKFKSRSFIVKYRPKNGLWNISLVFHDGHYATDKEEVRYTNEFVASSCDSIGQNPIREMEAIPYSGIYSREQTKFSNEFWTRPEVTARTVELEKTVSMLFKRGDVKIDSSARPRDTQEHTSRPKSSRVDLISRLSFGVSFGVAPVESNAGIFKVAYKANFSAEKELSRKLTYSPVVIYDYHFFPAKYLSASLAIMSSLNDQNHLKMTSLGMTFSRKITGWRKPLYLQPGFSIYSLKSEQLVGKISNPQKFNAGHRVIDASEIGIYNGEKRVGIIPSVQLTYKFKARISLFARASLSIWSSQHDKIFVREVSGSIFKRQSATLDTTQDTTISRDGTISSTTNFHYRPEAVIMNLGFRMGFQ
jgi:hypothetical protein